MKRFAILLAAAVLAAFAPSAAYKNVNSAEFRRLAAKSSVQVLDCRTAEEFVEGHIAGAIQIDVQKRSFRDEALRRLTGKKVAVYCRTGRRSRAAAEILSAEGYKVYNLEGGIAEWAQAGNPVEKINFKAMKKTYDFIKACGTYYIATADGGQPRVRPFGTINIFEGRLYIQTGHIKDVAKQIGRNGKVELCCFNGAEWLRLSGTLVEDERIEAKKSMLDAYPGLRSMYNENDGNTAVYYFTGATARFCSFTRPEEVVHF